MDCAVVGAAHESRATLTENEISKAKAVASKTWSPVAAGAKPPPIRFVHSQFARLCVKVTAPLRTASHLKRGSQR